MKKALKYYLVAWIALFLLFSAISILSVGWSGVEKYTPSFWIGYGLIVLMFFGQFACAVIALKDDHIQKTFYRISMVKTSYGGLIASVILGAVCMVISALPYWVGGIVCAVVLALTVVAVMGASAATELVADVDKKIKVQTFFIKSLTVDAEGLLARAKSDAAKAACKKVFEAVRYSDPMSNEALSSVESEITLKFAKFSAAVEADDASVTDLAGEVEILVKDRNKKCMLLK